MVPRHRVGPGQLRVLFAVMVAGRGATVQALADAMGVSKQSVWSHLRKLKAAGLVVWEDNKSGTLRSVVEFVPAARLFKEERSSPC